MMIQNMSDLIQKSCAQIINSHRELHVPVSKVGKVINAKFNADFSCVADTRLFQIPDNIKQLNQALVDHFLRHGMTDVAQELIREASLTVSLGEIDKFNEINDVLRHLWQKDLQPALNWAIKYRKQLQQLNSPLEFKIHRINIIELLKQGIEKQGDIIQYARDNLQYNYSKDVEQIMGAVIYLKSGIENSPYKSFMDPINYHEIEEIFVSNACALLDLSVRSPIAVTVEAGSVALPALLNINQILSNQGVQNVWQLRDELPIDINLDRKLQFHSTFSCPILKLQSNEHNPPMRLTCGHVITREALSKLPPVNNNSPKIKCPYCPQEQHINDAMQVHF